MLFDKGILLTYLGRGIFLPMGASPTDNVSNGNSSITIYSGVQPNSNVLINDWALYNTSYLLHKSDILYHYPNPDTKANSTFITLRTTPSAQTAQNTGTATWAIVWIGNQVESNVTGALIPSNNFIIGPVGNTTGNGIVKLDDANVVLGNTYNITDSTITITFG